MINRIERPGKKVSWKIVPMRGRGIVHRIAANPDYNPKYQERIPPGLQRSKSGTGAVYGDLWQSGKRFAVGKLRIEGRSMVIEFNKDEKGDLARRLYELNKLVFRPSKVVAGSVVCSVKS